MVAIKLQITLRCVFRPGASCFLLEENVLKQSQPHAVHTHNAHLHVNLHLNPFNSPDQLHQNHLKGCYKGTELILCPTPV